MAESVYNTNTGDIQGMPPAGFTYSKPISKEFNKIDNNNVDNIAAQPQISPRQVRTGQTRGDQKIRGLIKVEDKSGRTVVMMGYSQGTF